MAPRVLVSIINYRTGAMTIAAARSVLATGGAVDLSVAIVDNASGDGSDDEIAAWIAQTADPRLRLVRSATNSGFSGGHNQGMAVDPEADFYLILNSDTLLREGFFDPLLAAAEANPEAGLLAPQLECEDGTPQVSCFRFESPASEFIRGARSGPVTKFLKRHVVALDLPPEQGEIEWASFASILLRGAMVREIGPMDEGYFLYFEDAEYALRAARARWQTIYVPAARTVHFRGGSGPVKDHQAQMKRMPAYYWRSRTRFLRQAHGVAGPLLGNLAWMAGRGLAGARVLTGHSVPPSHEEEWRDIWTGLLQPLATDLEPRQ